MSVTVVRLQKFLSEAGIASRRAGEGLILEGRVSVNGRVIRELGAKVEHGADRVAVDGVPVKGPRRKLYVALNKPRGYVCTRSDPAGRRIISDLLPKEWNILHSVGRLDFESEGLIFLTNDGDFSLRLTHPRYGVRKTYRVVIEGKIEPPDLRRFEHGILSEGQLLKAERARLVVAHPGESVVEIELAEGKNREIRRLIEHTGLRIARLQRTRIGPIRLGELKPGRWRTLT